jgi:DNA-binding transcriptional MerR regulator
MSAADPGHTSLSTREVIHTLQVVARECGVSVQTVIEYREAGLLDTLPPEPAESQTPAMLDETLHRVLRIERLRIDHGMPLSALKLTLDLIDEVERLRSLLRLHR